MSDLRSILTAWHNEAGELTPQIVVDKARPEGAPLHDRFEWDDTIAGEKYRLVQAQQIIRSVKIEYTSPGTGERRSVRAFFSNREAGDPSRQGYRPAEEIIEDERALRILLRDMERDIAELKRRYGHLKEFADAMRAAIA